MLIGNKADLSNKYRRVNYEQASFFAHQNKCLFMEVSARKNSGIQEAFETLIKLFISNNNKRLTTTMITRTEDKKSSNKKSSSMIGKKDNRDCIIM